MRARLVLLALTCGAVLMAAPAAGQCTGATAPVNSWTPASLPFPTPTPMDFGNGYIVYATQLGISFQMNGFGTVCVSATTPNMGASTDGTYRKPIADVQIQLPAGTGSWVSVTQTPQAIYHAKFKNPTLLANVRILLSGADRAGTYQTSLTFATYH